MQLAKTKYIKRWGAVTLLAASTLAGLLWLTIMYRSAKGATPLLFALPFALSGGVFLQYWLGFHFNANWSATLNSVGNETNPGYDSRLAKGCLQLPAAGYEGAIFIKMFTHIATSHWFGIAREQTRFGRFRFPLTSRFQNEVLTSGCPKHGYEIRVIKCRKPVPKSV